jgi:hypothetical protein
MRRTVKAAQFVPNFTSASRRLKLLSQVLVLDIGRRLATYLDKIIADPRFCGFAADIP